MDLSLSGGIHQNPCRDSPPPAPDYGLACTEHYDRLGKSEAVLDSKYKFKTTADVGSFVYRIYVPELGREVEGEVVN